MASIAVNGDGWRLSRMEWANDIELASGAFMQKPIT
jgi:hypothetical protein